MESANPPQRVEPIGKVAPEPPRSLRIGVFVSSPLGESVASDVRDATLGAARTCESLGHQVEQIDCPFDGAMVDDFLAYWGFLSWIQQRTAWFMIHRGFDSSKCERWSRDLAATFSSSPRSTAWSIHRLRGFTRTYAGVMRSYDVLICPTVAHAPPPLGQFSPDLPFDTLFERLRRYVPFTPVQNTSGAPAISLPLGRSSEGLPIGVQLAAAHGEDRTLLELASSLEEATPWPKLAPQA
jgi:amidase